MSALKYAQRKSMLIHHCIIILLAGEILENAAHQGLSASFVPLQRPHLPSLMLLRPLGLGS